MDPVPSPSKVHRPLANNGGGYRKGSGRPKGAQTKRNLKRTKRPSKRRADAYARLAELNGELPHIFMLKVSQGLPVQVGRTTTGAPLYHNPTFDQRLEAARNAAPYFAPRLSMVQIIQAHPDAELDATLLQLGQAVGLDYGTLNRILTELDPEGSIPGTATRENEAQSGGGETLEGGAGTSVDHSTPASQNSNIARAVEQSILQLTDAEPV